jgi:hypothetical protein
MRKPLSTVQKAHKALANRRRYMGPAGDKIREHAREYWRSRNSAAPTRPCPELCEICDKPPTLRRGMALDHDHETKLFRGWLCLVCNTGLGKLGDSIVGLSKALLYLLNNTTGNLEYSELKVALCAVINPPKS